MNKLAYIICGPTASGKTHLSIDLAQKINGEIINADAMQVYEDVPTLSAAPTMQEMHGIPHHLFRYLDAFAVSNVSQWLKQVQSVFDNIDHPIFVGGTGLYIKALTEGLSPIPDIPDDIRTQVRAMSPDQIQSTLKTPVPFTDPQRLMRALEVEYATGKSILWWHTQPRLQTLSNTEFKIICILPPRDQLYAKCDARFVQMMNNGALKEVIALLGKNPQKTGGVFHDLGVNHIIDFIEGKIPMDQAILQSQLDTRHYAKRQITWFKHQIKADIILPNAKAPLTI